jgi:hypothetical protein
VDDPSNIGVGVGIGYYGISCNSADYASPTVRVAPLPDTAQAIKSSYPLPISGKALTPAITGAFSYVDALLRSDPSRDAAVILLTDGIGDPICGSTQANAAQAIARGLQGPPSARTYVIALGAGPTLLDPANIVDLSPLDALAAAGGTKQATRIDVALSTNEELTAALDAVVVAASPCAFEVPSDIDPNRAELEWETTSPALTTAWRHVASAAACGAKPGVFVGGAAHDVELCPASCDVLRSGDRGSIWIRSECP